MLDKRVWLKMSAAVFLCLMSRVNFSFSVIFRAHAQYQWGRQRYLGRFAPRCQCQFSKKASELPPDSPYTCTVMCKILFKSISNIQIMYLRYQDQNESQFLLVLVGGDGQDARAIHGSSRSATVHRSAFVPNGPKLVIVATLGWRNGPLLSTWSDDDDDIWDTLWKYFCELIR